MNHASDFIDVYEENANPIFRHCFFKVHDREVAKELMQETFLRAWKYAKKGKQIDNMRALLYKIASNLIVDHARKEKLKKHISLDYLLENGFQVGEDNTKRTQDQLDALESITTVMELKKKYQEVILLRYIEDLSIKEIAKTLGVKENTVSVRLYRALESLRNLIDNEKRP